MTTETEPPSIPPTIAEEGVRTWDTAITTATARVSAARLQYGYALLRLRNDVSKGDRAFGNKLEELGLKASKDVQADAQKVAKAVQSGDMTEEQALGLTSREIRLLSHTVREEDGEKLWHIRTPKPPKRKPKPAPPKEPDLFDTPLMPALGETATPATDDDASQAPAPNEATSTTPPEDPASGTETPADGDDGASGIEQRPDVEEAPEAVVEAAMNSTGIADKNGEAKQVGGAATTIPCLLPEALLAAIRKEVQSGKTPRSRLEANVADGKDTSSAARRMLLLMGVLAALGR